MSTSVDNLPPGWTVAKLSDLLAETSNGFGRRKQEQGQPSIVLRLADILDGRISWASTRRINASPNEIVAYALRQGDLLVIRVNGSPDIVGRIVMFDGAQEPALFCDHFIRLRLHQHEMASYLRYLGETEGVRRYVDQNSQKTLGQLEVPLPPLPELLRIVARIDELFSDLAAGVAALERVRRTLKRYRSAVLHAAVTGRLTTAWRAQHGPPDEPGPKLLERILAERRRQWEARTLEKYTKAGRQPPKDWRQRYPEPAAVKTEQLPRLPETWCWASADQLGWVQLGRQRSPRNRSDRYPTKYIRAANLTETGLDTSDVLDMEFEPHELDTYRLAAGDLLLSEASGSASQVGKPVVWRDELPDCAFQNTVIRLRPLVVGSDYLHTFFLHCYRNQVFASVARGVGINHLSVHKFSKVAVALPPCAEQSAVVEAVQEKISQIDALEAEIDRGLARASRLSQAILKAAFEGKLVPQDPNDEPAPTLLARLQSETTAALANGEAKPDSRATARKRRSRNSRALANGQAPTLFNDLPKEAAPKGGRRRKKQ